MRALSINKLEKPLTPPPSRVSKVFLNQGLSPPDPLELCVAAVCSESCPASLVTTDEFEFVTEAGPCVVALPASREGRGDSLRC